MKAQSRDDQTRFNSNICDLIASHLTLMTPMYIQFCSQQLSAAKLIQNKTENDPKFKEICQLCSQGNSNLLKPQLHD